jgi:hypothetical protein
MGKHRRSAARVRFTLRPPQLVERVDLRTGITHLLTTEATKAGRAAFGRYVAVCGAEVAPSDSTEPVGGCQRCHSSMPTQRSKAARSRQTTSPPVHKRALRTGMVDAVTEVEHLVSDAAMVDHQHSGRYLAKCGFMVLAHSLTAPPRGRCMVCVDAS